MTPPKTPKETILSEHYKEVLSYYEIVPQVIIDAFKRDVEEIRKQTEKLAECGNKSKPLLDEVYFSVGTYSIISENMPKYCHWSEGLKMVISKKGVTIKLNSDEIQELVKSLPRTIGGSY